MIKVSMAAAKRRLDELLNAVERGESVTICRRGTPVVDLVRTTISSTTKRRPVKGGFGTLKGRVVEIDPDWWKPMTDEEVDDFLEGRY
jgi:antitoxin (DNA-binding transcriptional repressor) of toxin-antitoxin stability system